MTAVLPAITEAKFQAQIVQLATLTGWLHFHTHDSRRSQEGFPDLVLVRPPQVIFVELKRSPKCKRSPAQIVWAVLLQRCPGVEYYLWTPERWEEIKRVLR